MDGNTPKKESDFDDPDKIPRAVVGLSIELAIINGEEGHRHQKAQLLYVISGVITVETSTGIWTVPPQCALWIPADVTHRARAAGQVSIGSLYIDPDVANSFRKECGIVFIQPLLRELILRFVREPQFYPEGVSREARLVLVLLDELQAAPDASLYLPMPRDRRLYLMAQTLCDDPSLRFTLEEWGARVGASNRTISRLFQLETGMSFGCWKRQLHIGLGLQRLAKGESVTNIAIVLGYESTSAFIAMFRRILGTTPTRYFHESMSVTVSIDKKKV